MAVSRSLTKRVKRNRAGEVTGTVWRARYRDDTGREHTRHFPRKRDGEQWLDEATAGLVTGTHVAPQAGRITFQEYAEQWRAMLVHRPTSAAHYETMLRRHVYPTLGGLALADVMPSHIQAWVKGISETLAPSTVGVVHGIVSSCFKAAVRDRRISRNPCDGTRLPDVPRSKVTPPNTADIVRLRDSIEPRYQALVHLIAATGLRSGEAFGLTVDRIDFLRQRITVDRQAVYLARKPITFGPPKRPASYRDVPIPANVCEALSRQIEQYGLGEHGLVFTSADGGFIRRSTFSAQVWQPAVKAAGLPTGTRLHDLRHYYASLLIRMGESVKTVQNRLGHATAAETLDTYGHLWPDSEDTTRQIAALALEIPAADYQRTTAAG